VSESPIGLSLAICLGLIALRPEAVRGEEALDADRYVAIVLRSHPAVGQSAGLEAAAAAARKAARLLPDPAFEFSWDRARPNDAPGTRVDETGYAVSQTIPWPGTYSAGRRAADREAEALSAGAEAVRWDLEVEARETFARLAAARALAGIAAAGEEDARGLRDLVTRRADLGESRESDRIKANVEWLRQRRLRAAADREVAAAEGILRALAVEPLPSPLEIRAAARGALPPVDHEAFLARVLERNPELRAARARTARSDALLSAARRGVFPDLAAAFVHENEIDKESNGFAVGVRVPLWNANRGEIARARAAAEIARAESSALRIEFSAEAEALRKELEIAASQTTLLDATVVPEALRSVELARFSYEEGEISLLDLLDAQRTYRETQREAAEARLALATALAGVQRLAGPDFDPWR
jgi:cobalt-zinc-cadmium efflux system outer membrane protein